MKFIKAIEKYKWHAFLLDFAQKVTSGLYMRQIATDGAQKEYLN